MPEICQLPVSVINKIAAGEVIERPASVVKELVENSVDAGATRIQTIIGKGGTEFITVSDNGCGISADQLKLAVASHATSKLRDADDLFHVGTLGFRGEALASISEVSQFTIRSRTDEKNAGAELEINGGQLSSVEPCGCPMGTSITVRNLFFNTPVRRKFLKTVQTEMGHITEALTRIALPHPQVHFSLQHNQREIHDLPRTDDWRERIAALFGHELADDLIPVQAEQDAIRMSGFVAMPNQNRGNNRMQYLFLNGRHIKDRALSHALTEAYRGLLMTGRYAIAFLKIDMPADQVDVNVHPTKMEVRFQESGRLYSQLLGMIRSRFLATDLTAHARLDENRVANATSTTAAADAGKPGFSNPSSHGMTGDASGSESRQWARSQVASDDGLGVSTPEFRKFADTVMPLGNASLGNQRSLDMRFPSAGSASVSDRPPQPGSHPEAMTMPVSTAAAYNGEWTSGGAAVQSVSVEGTPAMQVYNRYLITETPEGLVVIDQHALHERILYEEIREKVLAGSAETQRLLVPEPVPLTSEECAAVLENQQTLAQLGVEVEPFGNDTVLVSSYPAMLAKLNAAEVVRQMAERLLTPEKQLDRRDLLDELLHMISCKAAIKAGDRLTPEEINALLERRHLCQDAHHCPHGRPTTLVFSRSELDRRFKRI